MSERLSIPPWPERGNSPDDPFWRAVYAAAVKHGLAPAGEDYRAVIAIALVGLGGRINA